MNEVVGDPGGAPCSPCDFLCTVFVERGLQQFATALDDRREVIASIIVEAGLQREATSHRSGQQTDSGGRSDECETWNLQANAASIRPLVDHDIDSEILHSRIQVFLHGLWQAVDFVDEENVTLLKVR